MTSQDSARATEPRATETVLELRLGARFGSGMGERDRERALEEAAVATAARTEAVAASWPDSSLRDVEDAAGGAVVAAEAARRPAAAGATQDPGDADRNGVLELGNHGELGCKPTQVFTARHGATTNAAGGHQQKRAKLRKQRWRQVL